MYDKIEVATSGEGWEIKIPSLKYKAVPIYTCAVYSSHLKNIIHCRPQPKKRTTTRLSTKILLS
ncbi:hypothetical protein GCM10028895_46540 [Pontibacter rugosus]